MYVCTVCVLNINEKHILICLYLNLGSVLVWLLCTPISLFIPSNIIITKRFFYAPLLAYNHTCIISNTVHTIYSTSMYIYTREYVNLKPVTMRLLSDVERLTAVGWNNGRNEEQGSEGGCRRSAKVCTCWMSPAFRWDATLQLSDPFVERDPSRRHHLTSQFKTRGPY